MTARQRPLRDCSGPGACYAEGQAAGKNKAYFEMLASLEGPPHAKGCACQPCQVKRACLQKVLTLMARSSPGILELVEAWALGTMTNGTETEAVSKGLPDLILEPLEEALTAPPADVGRSTWWTRRARRWRPRGSSRARAGAQAHRQGGRPTGLILRTGPPRSVTGCLRRGSRRGDRGSHNRCSVGRT